MLNKKLILAIVVIAIVAIAGVFLAMKFVNGDKVTGNAVDVPKTTEANETDTTQPEETATPLAPTIDASKFSEITEGMLDSDVVDLVGAPTEKQSTKTAKGHDIEYWYYTDSSKTVWQIGISNGEVQVVRAY